MTDVMTGCCPSDDDSELGTHFLTNQSALYLVAILLFVEDEGGNEEDYSA